jgi:RHS repeat-associated protein
MHFGLQTANSWTRTGVTGNNFLGNGGTELNTTTSLYDLDWRNYDPVLGRLNQVDLMADKYGSLSPYHFSFNNPVGYNDPSGLSPITDGTWGSDEWIAGDQARAVGGGGGSGPIRSDGNGGYYTDSNGNGVQDDGEEYATESQARAYYSQSWSTVYQSGNGQTISGLNVENGGFWIDYEGVQVVGNGNQIQDGFDVIAKPSRFVSFDNTPNTIWNVDAGLMAGVNLFGRLRAEINVVSVGLWSNDPNSKNTGKVKVSNSVGLSARLVGSFQAGVELGQEQQIKTSSLYSDPADYLKTFSADIAGFEFGGTTNSEGVTSFNQNNSFSIDLIFIKVTATTH